MKYLLINSVCGIRSTGRICTDIAQELEKAGNIVKIAYGREEVPDDFEKYAVRIGTDMDAILHAVRTRILDEHGFGSRKATCDFLQWAEDYDPDILWLHNIHGYYINIELLFDWIKSRPKMQVKWTLHDCWAFTGHCSHFSFVNCEQWKTHCESCCQKKEYPSSIIIDNCFENYERKRMAFTGVKDLTIITPSKWLAELVKKSFLKEYPIEVHHNTIDTNVFKPTPSDFSRKHHLENKTIVLAVASSWGVRKGLNDLLSLSRKLDNSYVLVIVGLSKKQISKLKEEDSFGEKLLCIERTNDAKELAEIYTASDVFVNTTYEDNYPTVNLEAQACGTPCITYNTGGSIESVPPSNVIEQGDIEELYKKITSKEYVLGD